MDPKGNEIKASPFLSSIIPVRIPSNDILRGELVFAVPNDFDASKLVWEEFDKSMITVDLNSIKNPPDPVPTSDITLSSNKGKMLSDGRTQLTIHDDLLNKSPSYYIVDLSLKNLSKEPLKYTVTYFFLKDQDGVLYPPDLTNFQSMKNPIKQGELKEGEEVRGQVLFALTSNNLIERSYQIVFFNNAFFSLNCTFVISSRFLYRDDSINQILIQHS